MNLRAVGTRCALIPEDFLPEFGDHDELRARIAHGGWSILAIDPVTTARALVGHARYRRGARMREAPEVVDCSSLTKWVYGQLGIWIPRRSIQQAEMGLEISIGAQRPGDLIFSSGWRNYYRHDPRRGIGHVGLVTDTDAVVHAASRRVGVVETPIDRWLDDGFRGIRRPLPARPYWTVDTRPDDEVESTDDLLWMLRIRSSSFPQGSP